MPSLIQISIVLGFILGSFLLVMTGVAPAAVIFWLSLFGAAALNGPSRLTPRRFAEQLYR